MRKARAKPIDIRNLLTMNALVSPKQRTPENRRDWYPYYAGFTERFARDILSGPLAGSRFVLDPWSGSGTTTAACAKQGIKSVGLDVNPVLTVIARARLTPLATRDSLLPLAKQICDAARSLKPEPYCDDLLSTWMRAPSLCHVRAIQEAIHRSLTSDKSRPGPHDLQRTADCLPMLACFFYTALFATVRDLLSRFRSTNPTWLREPASPKHRIAPTWSIILDNFQARVCYFHDRIAVPDDMMSSRFRSFRTGSAEKLPFASGVFDGALTSPPYATRIDYVMGVLPELAVLGATATTIAELRRATTGSPVVHGVTVAPGPLHTKYGCQVLQNIRNHSSRGSPAYYWPWMSNYLQGLQAGLFEVARTVKRKAPLCIVVQDTHYKELHVNLQRIVIEILLGMDRSLHARHDFAVTSSRSRMNPRARLHLRDRDNVESLLVFR